tara:strand:+ start:15423 stop:16766 length:1344 start_codon:yes stop_codon:yes gene_type:complete
LSEKNQVLFLGWTTKGRDIEIDTPLMYFFEEILGWSVLHKTIFNLPEILKTNPDMVVMTNTTGGSRQVEIARLVKDSGFPFFSHVSEGMYREESIEEFVWGSGRCQKKLSETLSMLWSQRAYDLATHYFPATKEIFRVSGAVGFDKYKFLEKAKPKLKNKYKRVIGYAAFDFLNIKSNKSIRELLGEDKYQRLMAQAPITNNILKNLIRNNNDILFILKNHPGDGENSISLEFEGLLDFENVQVMDRNVSIVDIINASDLWLNLNSSTNLEAWLMDKPSISFYTDEANYSSEVIYGSVIEYDINSIQSYINEFYETGSILAFNEKKEFREQLISDYIGYSDGLNHVRYMSCIKDFVELIESDKTIKGKWKISLSWRIKSKLQHLLYSMCKSRFGVPFFKRWAEYYDIYNQDELLGVKNRYYSSMRAFYSKNQKLIDEVYNNFANTGK